MLYNFESLYVCSTLIEIRTIQSIDHQFFKHILTPFSLAGFSNIWKKTIAVKESNQ